MSRLYSFNVISGIITIMSFVFGVWVWIKSSWKVRELFETIQALHDIAGSALWESSQLVAEDYEAKARQGEKTLGHV
jgi:hypothetical protein